MPPLANNSSRRAVIVTRRSAFEQLVERHGTLGQAEFFLRSRGDSISPYIEAHERLAHACQVVESAMPADQRRARVDRDHLERFLFAPDDIVVIVGQDGLVANVAKYLRGQVVVAINPDPSQYDGVLCCFAPAAYSIIAQSLDRPKGLFRVQERTLAQATLGDGQCIVALNEVFVGHCSHQSARYRIATGDGSERHSSSGLICATGTGCTGWARSIVAQRRLPMQLPKPQEKRLAWFVREPFPSVSTQTALDAGTIDASSELSIVSEMSEGGVIFGDGIESDRIEFAAGSAVRITIAAQSLNLLVKEDSTPSRG